MGTSLLRSMDRSAVVAALEEHQRERAISWTLARGGEVRDEGDLFLYVSGAPIEWANGVGGARLTEATVEDRIQEVRAFFATRGVPASWWLGELSMPPDLGRRLGAHGLRRAEDIDWMTASLSPPPPPGPAPAGFEVRLVDDRETQVAWLEAMRVGFGQSPDQTAMLGATADAIGWSAEGPWVRFACLDGGRPVASSGLLLYGPVAGVYNVATDPRFRRRGLATHMTTVAMRHAADLGYAVAVLGASHLGRGVYERLGFRDLTREARYALRP